MDWSTGCRVAVRPKKGRVVVFFPGKSDMHPDPRYGGLIYLFIERRASCLWRQRCRQHTRGHRVDPQNKIEVMEQTRD